MVLEFCKTHKKMNSFTAGKNFIASKTCKLHILHCKDQNFFPLKKQSRNRPGVAQRVPGGLGSKIS
jgi:hypothetical protein